MDEVWRDIHDFKGYQASNLGHIKSFKRNNPRVLKPSCDPRSGHPYVNLSHKIVYVHTLVALAFIGPRPAGTYILHKNGNRSDLRPENLIYSRFKRIYHKTKMKKIDKQQRSLLENYIRWLAIQRYRNDSITLKQAGQMIGLSESAMCRLVKGDRRPYLMEQFNQGITFVQSDRWLVPDMRSTKTPLLQGNP